MTATVTSEGALATAKAVANFFLQKGSEDGVPIDQLKLQKLVFYSHAWHLAYGMGPLFPDDIEAWPHGPVMRDLYVEFNDFRYHYITRRAKDLNGQQPDIKDAPENTRSLLASVWDVLRANTGVELSNATHRPGEPWTIVKERFGGNLVFKPRIPNELIERVFKEKLAPA